MTVATKEFNDKEFGIIQIRRLKNARRLTVRFDTKRRLVVVAPSRTPLFIIRSTIDSSRQSIRRLIASQSQANLQYEDGMQLGKSHRLRLISGDKFTHSIQQGELIISYPQGVNVTDEAVQSQIRPLVAKVLRQQARHYLPRRLAYLAKRYGYKYEKVRLSHAGGRWGSASSKGTISLNIALMNLPFELIDYVLIHELCHTVEMNHSKQFWELVSRADTNFKAHREELKQYHPTV